MKQKNTQNANFYKNFQIKFLYSGMKLKDIPPSQVPEFVLVGRSNVGKSSLLNALSGQKKLAFVSQTPGRTKTINIFSADNDAFYIADLPGYGFSQSAHELSDQWADSVQEYFERRKNIACVVFLIDVRRKMKTEDINLVQWFKTLGLNLICVQTKCDKVSKTELMQQKIEQSERLLLNPTDVFSISVYKKIGLQELCNQFIKMAKRFAK